MKVASVLAILTLTSVLLSACQDKFESNFYKAIDDGALAALKNGNNKSFDLSSITDFKWDSVLIIRGNESVPVLSEEIERELKRPTIDLPVDKDRFYFLQRDKSIIVKELNHRSEPNKTAFDIELCLTDSTQQRSWLSQQECKFRLMSNSKIIGDGTIFLFPPCLTTVIPDSLKIN